MSEIIFIDDIEKEDLIKLSKNQLLHLCENLGIVNYKSKTKQDLINIILEISNTNQKISCTGNLKFVDLFCGIGGFHQALQKINQNIHCVLACDIDKNCRDIYTKNYGIEPLEDIKKIDEKSIPDFDILCAGFPCQAFSNGGKKRCFDDERGLLFDEIMRIARYKKPSFMFLENVKHILKVSNGQVIKYIKDKINEIGYVLQIFQISPHNYGVPQQRERIYFVCVRNDIYNGSEIVLPNRHDNELTKEIKLEKYLLNYDQVDKKYFLEQEILNVLNAWDEMIKIFLVGEKLSPTILINGAFKNYTNDQIAKFPKWKRDYMTKNKPLLNKYYNSFQKWYEKWRELLTKREIYGKLEWQTGLVKNNESIFNHFIQLRQSGIRVKKNKYFPTPVAISQIPIYGKEKRYITPRECARLQCFPDNFILDHRDKISYKQLGNSINVDNAKMVIRATLQNYSLVS
jgi:DNA (cytosine-5)-methyltransferase 1